MKSGRRLLLQRLVLVALSVVVSLVLAEGLLRVYFWRLGIGRGDVRDVLARSRQASLSSLHGGAGLFGLIEPSPWPDVVYQVKPHLQGSWRDRPLRTNRFGMRGPDVEKEKPARTVRIACLGDSHLFGSGVGQDELYTRLLERRLNRHAADGYRFEVLNFGAPGYNTVMEVATLEHRALAFAPDVVLVHFIGNDFNPPHFLRPPRGLAPSRWYLVEMVRGLRYKTDTENWDEEADDVPARDVPSRRERRSAEEYRHMGGLDAYRQAMQRLRSVTAERRLPVLVFLLGQNTPRRQKVRDVTRELGLPFLNTSPYFDLVLREKGRGRTFQQAFVRGDDHPKPLGHEAYARALFCELWRLGVPHLRQPEEGDCLPRLLTEQPQAFGGGG